MKDDLEPDIPWFYANGFHRPMQPASSNRWSTRDGMSHGNGTMTPFVGLDMPTTRRHGEEPVWVVWELGEPTTLKECPTQAMLLGMVERARKAKS